MLWCFAVFSRGFPGKHAHTKHQISQAQLKAEKETSAKALAECEKLKAQVRPTYCGVKKNACGRVSFGKKCQW